MANKKKKTQKQRKISEIMEDSEKEILLNLDLSDLEKTINELTKCQMSLLDKIINYSTEDLKARLSTKNKEYAEKNDVYHNFIDGAKHLDLLPMQYAYYLMTKQLVSVKDMIKKGNVNKDLIAEKCGDIRAYVTLIEGYYLFNE